ncbi:uncharacterized protein LOC117643711 [Thrips palmi]|uniref:Uncharacterized protein LOC117643711 n=1 Tax=Thrips palmi TaxID=161013 RepID=A0A6P8YN84_THRPL|nr:uncharacterized protein LOC117643711 [Thrips palmi]
MSGLQASGDELWALVEEDGYFPADLKLILKATKFDNLFALSRFDMDKDLKEIESFMQNTLPNVISSSKYEEYYSIFKDNPKAFVFVGGLRAALKLLVDRSKSIISFNKKRLNSSDNVSDTNTSSKKNKVTPSNSEPTNKSICDGKADLEKTIKNYIAANYPSLKDKEIVCKVVRDGLGSLVAEANCPVQDCEEERKITRNVTRWNTSNFYAHIRSHFSKRKNNNLSKNVTPIDSVFKPVGGKSRRTQRTITSSDESDADDPNGEKTIENGDNTEGERESGNEKDKGHGGARNGDMIENNSPEESADKQRCDDSSSNKSF